MKTRLVSGAIRFEVIGKDKLRLTHDAVVHVLDRDWSLLAGDETDLSSYPGIGYLLYDPFEGAAAGVWHDLRYVRGDVTRKEADRGWYELAIAGHSKGYQNAEVESEDRVGGAQGWRLAHLGPNIGNWADIFRPNVEKKLNKNDERPICGGEW